MREARSDLTLDRLSETSPGPNARQPAARQGFNVPPTLVGLDPERCVSGAVHIPRHLSKMLSTTVNFRDCLFVTSEVNASKSDLLTLEAEHASLHCTKLVTGVQKNKLIIIMVGLPGRGKTFLCNKIMRYLNWLGHSTRHFNVGMYRRCQKNDLEIQDAQFFNHSNAVGREARQRALEAALQDMMQWLDSDSGQVAIFDATNSTEERRNYLRKQFHGRWSYTLLESICNEEEVLRQNYLNKMLYSPDYVGMETDQALADFTERIQNYEKVYETVTDRTFHYIKLTNMVTGRGHMDLNRISGFVIGKVVQLLMQVCKAGCGATGRKIWLTRHGQSRANELERLGGDTLLSDAGECYAQLLPSAVMSRLPAGDSLSLSVWTSTLKRTICTARSLPFPKIQWKALDEIDAGICDGMTYPEIAAQMPEEYIARKADKLKYRYPSGESYLDVIQRLEPVVTELERERESVVVVSHQAVLRTVYGYFMGVPQEKIPSLEIPLHTLIELIPMPDGTMHELRIKVDVTRGAEQFPTSSPNMSQQSSTVPLASHCGREAESKEGVMCAMLSAQGVQPPVFFGTCEKMSMQAGQSYGTGEDQDSTAGSNSSLTVPHARSHVLAGKQTVPTAGSTALHLASLTQTGTVA